MLRFDLERHNIGVTLVCPGGVDTPITQAVDIAGLERGELSNSPVAERFRKHAKSPEHAAECILDGIVRVVPTARQRPDQASALTSNQG